jgi:hypothetical protein
MDADNYHSGAICSHAGRQLHRIQNMSWSDCANQCLICLSCYPTLPDLIDVKRDFIWILLQTPTQE